MLKKTWRQFVLCSLNLHYRSSILSLMLTVRHLSPPHNEYLIWLSTPSDKGDSALCSLLWMVVTRIKQKKKNKQSWKSSPKKVKKGERHCHKLQVRYPCVIVTYSHSPSKHKNGLCSYTFSCGFLILITYSEVDEKGYVDYDQILLLVLQTTTCLWEALFVAMRTALPWRNQQFAGFVNLDCLQPEKVLSPLDVQYVQLVSIFRVRQWAYDSNDSFVRWGIRIMSDIKQAEVLTLCQKIKKVVQSGDPSAFLRISVDSGGCSGLQYNFDIGTQLNEDDV